MEILPLLMMIRLVRLGILLVRKCKFCRCQMELDLTKGLAQVGFHFQVNVSLSVTKTCVPGKSTAKIFLSLFSNGQQRKAASSGFATKLNPFFLSFEHIGSALRLEQACFGCDYNRNRYY